MNEFILVIGMFVVTFFLRYLPFGLSESIKINSTIERALKFIPIAVLMAIVAPSIFIEDFNSKKTIFENHYFYGAFACFIIGFWKNNLFITITIGMTTFFISKLIIELIYLNN